MEKSGIDGLQQELAVKIRQNAIKTVSIQPCNFVILVTIQSFHQALAIKQIKALLFSYA